MHRVLFFPYFDTRFETLFFSFSSSTPFVFEQTVHRVSPITAEGWVCTVLASERVSNIETFFPRLEKLFSYCSQACIGHRLASSIRLCVPPPKSPIAST